MKTDVVSERTVVAHPECTFADFSANSKTMCMGEYTNVIGDFIDKKTLVVSGPDLTSTATVYTRHEKPLLEAHNAFGKFFEVGHIVWLGQGNFGFNYDVADLTPEDYADLLEKTYHFLTLTSR